MPNVFGIADDILVVGYEDDGMDHDNTLRRVLLTCGEVNLKLNKDKSPFRCSPIPLFGKIISRNGVRPSPRKLKALTKMLPQIQKRNCKLSLK